MARRVCRFFVAPLGLVLLSFSSVDGSISIRHADLRASFSVNDSSRKKNGKKRSWRDLL